MTTWVVVDEDTRQKRWQDRLPLPFPRLVLLAALTAVIISLGMAVTPLRPAISPEQALSGQARTSALADALRLRDAGTRLEQRLGDPDSGAAAPALRQESAGTVTLLTTHSRALLTPAGRAPGPGPSAPGTPTASAAAPSPAPPAPAKELAADLAADLAASGSQRLADAAGTDGGTARLLASIGAAQLIRSAALATAAGAPVPAGPDPAAATDPAGMAAARDCPSRTAVPLPATGANGGGADSAGSGDGNSAGGGGPATLETALAAAIAAEQRAVYGYQVALPRLSAGAAAAAAAHLASHHRLVSAAEAFSRTHCAPEPLPGPGYALEGSFLTAPSAGLAALEDGTLPAFADLVALSDGSTRTWAIGALLGAARRADGWGTDPGALPGLPGIEAELPPQPNPIRSPGT